MWGKRQGCYGMSRATSRDYIIVWKCLQHIMIIHPIKPSCCMNLTAQRQDFQSVVPILLVDLVTAMTGSCSNAHEYTALSLGSACPAKPFCQPHILLIRRQFTNSHVAWRPS